MRIVIAILFALSIGSATAETGLPAPCASDFNVHAYADGQPVGEAVVNESAIRSVSRRAEDSERLMIALTEPAAAQMKKFTGEHIGEELVVICDGESVWRARIKATFGERFEIRLPQQSSL
ncbi:MAG: hypothetical protein U5L08_10700 [Xanthomonadales bacterium]|nr:hypothetical protein [Xanthomonadales bacterium]